MRPLVRGRAKAGTAGLTLLELVIAVFILAIASMAALRANEQSRRGIGEELARVLAQEVALNRSEELKLFGLARGRDLPVEVVMGGQSFALDHREKATAGGLVEVTISARAASGPGAVIVAYLPAEVTP